MDQIVTLETAKLAREVGFNGKVLHFYNHGENELIPSTILISPPIPISVEHLETSRATLPVDCVPAPTQTTLSRWLREKHGLFIMIMLDDFGYWYEIHNTPNTGDVKLLCGCMESGNEYEDAMETAFRAACQIVKERETL